MRKTIRSLPLLGFLTIVSLGGNYQGYGVCPIDALNGMLVLVAIATSPVAADIYVR